MNPTLFRAKPTTAGSTCAPKKFSEQVAAEAELGVREPARWKFISAIRHVLSAEHPECEHLFRRELNEIQDRNGVLAVSSR